MNTVNSYSVPNAPKRSRERPKLLFLTQTLPHPPVDGASIRTFNVMRLLSRVFDITALCFDRAARRPSTDAPTTAVTKLHAWADVHAFPIEQENKRTRLIWDHVRSITLRRPYTHYLYASKRFSKLLSQLLTNYSFSLIHMDSLDLARYLPSIRDTPIVCTHHNVESELLAQRARWERSWWIKSYMKSQSRLLEATERRWCGVVGLNITVSAIDAERLSTIAPGAKISVVPNGVDTRLYSPDSLEGEGLVFVGSSGWFPNRDAMAFFVEDIWPHLRSAGNPQMTWVGWTPPNVRHEYERKYGIRLTGYVEDVRPYVKEAACCVVPLRIGGGTRLKILEAWALGKAVVSTSVGCEGLEVQRGQNILVEDSAIGFASAVRRVLGDAELRKRLGEAGRETAKRLYDWEVVGGNMIQEYLDMCQISM